MNKYLFLKSKLIFFLFLPSIFIAGATKVSAEILFTDSIKQPTIQEELDLDDLDWEQLSKNSQPSAEEYDEMRLLEIVKVLKNNSEYTEVLKPLIVDNRRWVVTWTECSKITCYGYVAIVRHNEFGGNFVLEKRVRLRFYNHIWNNDGVSFFDSEFILYDVDQDGKKELLMRYSTTEPPEPAIGSRVNDYVAIFNLPSLNQNWFYRTHTRRSGAERACEHSVKLKNNSRSYLIVEGKCGPLACLEQSDYLENKECFKLASRKEYYIWFKKLDRYIKSKNG